jgi:hypothetical protein
MGFAPIPSTVDMATDSSDFTAESSDSPGLIDGSKMLLYGFLAAGGGMAVTSGIRDYQLYMNGVPDSVLHLVGVLFTLGIGFTFLLIAVSGAVAAGVSSARSN